MHAKSYFVPGASPKNLPELYGAARREFLEENSYDSPFMLELRDVFRTLGQEAFGGDFVWSDYNQGQWKKFVSENPSWGGACAFSLEADGMGPPERMPLKGLYVGNPIGIYPYTTAPLQTPPSRPLRDIVVEKLGFTPDLVD